MYVSVRSESRIYHPGAYRMRCFLNDVEVTHQCFEANEEQGFVNVMKLDQSQKMYQENGDLATEVLEGVVRLICDECEQHPSNPKEGCQSLSHAVPNTIGDVV